MLNVDSIGIHDRGSGQNSIYNYDTGTGKTDVIEFAVDIVPSDAFCFIQLNSAHGQIKQRKRVSLHFSAFFPNI